MTLDAPRKIMLANTLTISALILIYAGTPWHKAANGLVTFIGVVLVISGVSLALALWRYRVDKVAGVRGPS